MKSWQIDARGEWIEVDAPDWQDDDETLDAWALRCGFEHGAARYSTHRPRVEDYDVGLTVYDRAKESKAQHRYLATWKDGEGTDVIFVVDFPALLKLQALVAPMIQAFEVDMYLKPIHAIAERAWRVSHRHRGRTHGFATDTVCEECDPDRWRQLEADAKERAARKAGT